MRSLIAPAPKPLGHCFLRFFRTVVESTEPFVHRNELLRAVIDLEILVMKIVGVMIVVDTRLVVQGYPAKSGMALRRRERHPLKVKKNVQRVRRNDPVQEHR